MSDVNVPDFVDPRVGDDADIVAILRGEAAYVDVAIAVHDDITVEYSQMCIRAADEIETLRERVKLLEGRLDAMGRKDF